MILYLQEHTDNSYLLMFIWQVAIPLLDHSCYTPHHVEEITPEQSSVSLTTSLKLFITQMHNRIFGLIGPRQVHAEYKMHTCRTIYTSTTWRVTSSVPTQYRRYMYSSVANLMAVGSLAVWDLFLSTYVHLTIPSPTSLVPRLPRSGTRN